MGIASVLTAGLSACGSESASPEPSPVPSKTYSSSTEDEIAWCDEQLPAVLRSIRSAREAAISSPGNENTKETGRHALEVVAAANSTTDNVNTYISSANTGLESIAREGNASKDELSKLERMATLSEEDCASTKEIYADVSKTYKPKDPDEPSDPKVTYKISGTANSALITYMNASGNIAQENNARVPWKKTFKQGVSHLSVSAQNKGGGTITCEILIDGERFKKTTSKGDYAIAECSGG